jgi:PAS domain S-box-containing protein
MSNVFKTLQARVMLALALTGILPLAIIGLSVAVLDSQALGEQSARELTGLASGLAGELHIYLDNTLKTSQVIADLPEIAEAEAIDAEVVLRRLFIHFNQFSHLAILDLNGKEIASALPNRLLPLDPATVETAASTGLQTWLIAIEPTTEDHAFVTYTPIRNTQRQVTSLLVTVVDLQDVAGMFDRVRASAGAEAFVMESNGHILLHPDSVLSQQHTDHPDIGLSLDDEPIGAGTTKYQTASGDQIAGYAPIPDYGWNVLVARPRSDVLGPATRSLRLTIAGLVISAIVALLTAVYLANRLVRPVKELAVAAQAFGTGNYTAPLPSLARDDGELGTLVAAFRGMRLAVSKREEALRQSEQRLSLHFEQAPLAALELSLDGRVHRWNPAAETIFGYTREEAIGQSIFDLIVPKTGHGIVQAVFNKLVEQRISLQNTNQNITKNGDLITCEWNNTPLVDPDGTVFAISSLGQNITERKLAEEDLHRLANRLEAIHQIDKAILSSQSPEVIANTVLNQVKNLVPCKRGSVVKFVDTENFSAAIIVAGYADYATNLGVGRLVTYESQDLIDHMRQGRSHLARNLAKETRLPSPDNILYAEGIRCYLSIPLMAQNQLTGILHIGVQQPDGITANHIEIAGEAAASLAIALQQAELNQQIQQHAAKQEETIAQLQQAEAALVVEKSSLARRVKERTAELITANAELARANRLKDEFLAAMSHELRTPLNAILGMAQMLEEQIYGPSNPRQLNAAALIASSGQHLLSLINDILDLSKIEAGKTELELKSIHISEICQASVRMVKQSAHKKEINISSTIDDDVTTFLADERRVKQILVNLLNNAVKFTPKKGKVGLNVVADDPAGMINFIVWDTGIGIAPEDTERLFQPFVQLDSRLARNYEGTGLGLALVYQLTRLHNGSVSVESVPGEGSRFTVSLPLAPESNATAEKLSADFQPAEQQPDDPTTVSEHGTERQVVLLVEDNEANIVAVAEYLEYRGYKMVIARDGVEGLQRARETQPDLILMDIQLPEMDGLEATRRLRADAVFADTPIIALTALTMPGDREKCLAAGANGYMSKPVNLTLLLKAIETQLHKIDELDLLPFSA